MSIIRPDCKICGFCFQYTYNGVCLSQQAATWLSKALTLLELMLWVHACASKYPGMLERSTSCHVVHLVACKQTVWARLRILNHPSCMQVRDAPLVDRGVTEERPGTHSEEAESGQAATGIPADEAADLMASLEAKVAARAAQAQIAEELQQTSTLHDKVQICPACSSALHTVTAKQLMRSSSRSHLKGIMPSASCAACQQPCSLTQSVYVWRRPSSLVILLLPCDCIQTLHTCLVQLQTKLTMSKTVQCQVATRMYTCVCWGCTAI